MRELTPLKVKIGLRPTGEADYPDFNTLNVVKESGLDWSKYVDIYGLGWKYDKVSGHKDETTDSPFGQQWGVLLITKTFADEAVKSFADSCEIINETDYETFHNEKVTAHLPDEEINKQVVESIAVQKDAGVTLSATQKDALDPKTETPGIRKNSIKKYADFKITKNIKII